MAFNSVLPFLLPAHSVDSGLEFDGGTAAICRRASGTGRNALWMKC